ncbi:MAG: CRTAC1 family protein [Planctomycetota bacterium]
MTYARRAMIGSALSIAGLLTVVGCTKEQDDTPPRDPTPTTDAQSTAAQPSTAPATWFIDRAADLGIDFMHQSGHRETFYTPEIVCGGAALLDINNDGWLDIYLVQSGSIDGGPSPDVMNRLYRNRGDGTFEDVTAESGAGDTGYGVMAAAGDYDNDGDVDLYVVNVGPNVLLRNDGDGRFEPVEGDGNAADDGFGSTAAFFDYDHDGDLDLFSVNYLVWSADRELSCFDAFGHPDYCDPSSYDAPAFDRLYRNNGDGTFSDVSETAGIASAPGTGLGIVCGDFTGNGWPDVFIANDGRNDHLWVNHGDGTFTEEAMQRGCAIDLSGHAKAGMGVTAGDIDDDGDLDVLVCNLQRETDSLFENENGQFLDITTTVGLGSISRAFTRFGLGWVDFNNDGTLDLYAANGRVATTRNVHSETDAFAEPNLVFAGSPGPRFTEVKPRGGTPEPLVATSRGAAFGDLNNDGGIDIVVANRDAAPYVLQNRAAASDHWLLCRVIESNRRHAIGAIVTLAVGERTLRRDVRRAYSYCASNDPRVHFGLGATTDVASIDVKWVDGTTERFEVGGVDQVMTLVRGSGTIIPE